MNHMTGLSWLKRTLSVATLGAALALSGCEVPQGARQSTASGSLALSTDDALLYAADTDNGILAVVDTATQTKIAQVKVGARPYRVVVGQDDTIFVANRGDRSVSVIRRGDWSKEAARLATGVDPVGMQLGLDGKTLYVVSATAADTSDYGVLTAFDVATLERRWETPVGRDPRGLALVGKRALVTHYIDGQLVEVDLDTHQALGASDAIYTQANLTPSSGSTFRPRALADAVASADGKRVFVPAIWAREDAIARPPSAIGGGYYSSGGPCGVGPVATAGIVTLDTSGPTATPLVDDFTSCGRSFNSDSPDYPPTATAPPGGVGSTVALQGPSVAVIDSTGAWLFVVHKESRNVAVLPASRRSGGDLNFGSSGSTVRSAPNVGQGADGIALSRDGSKAYVYSQFDHQLDTLTATGRGDSAEVVNTGSPLRLADDVLSANDVLGRNLFFDATDERMSSALTRVACSTCHLEGRDDGHTWNFPDGPRQTPTLAGRKLLATAPYHWSGEFAEVKDFMNHTVRERMGGTGLSDTLNAKLASFLDGLAGPENANRGPSLTPAQARGQVAFAKAACGTCHAGAAFDSAAERDVGTLVLGASHSDNGRVVSAGFNVPSLLSVARTAPYLHDGSAQTLEARVFSNAGDKHGVTSVLTDAEKQDLVAYLKSL